METIEIKVNISRKEYININFRLFFSNWIIIVVTFLGVLNLVGTMIYWAGAGLDHLNPHRSLFIGLVFTFLFPVWVYVLSVRAYKANEALGRGFTYTVSAEKIITEGPSFKTEYTWVLVDKIKILKTCMLLYLKGRKQPGIIPLSSFSSKADEAKFKEFAVQNGIKIK